MAYKDHIVKIRHTYFVSNDAQLSVHAPNRRRLDTWKEYFEDENTSWRTRDLSLMHRLRVWQDHIQK